MFYLTYIRRELSRRAGRTILTVLGLAVGIGLVVVITALSTGLDRAQAHVLDPLGSVGTDLLVTRSIKIPQPGQAQPGSIPSEDDQKALTDEAQAATQAAVIDISKLGKPGERFSTDFFMPTTQVTFPTDKAQDVARLPGVSAVSSGLTLVAGHREGTVPEIVAEFRTPQRTIRIEPPTAAEQASINACIQKLPRPSPPPPPPQGQKGPIAVGPPPGFIKCLPDRFRQQVIQSEVMRQVVAPPQTDISQNNYAVAGVDRATPGMGMITPAQLTKGGFFSREGVTKEAILNDAYALKKDLAVGSTLSIKGTSFKVVGLAKPPLGGQAADVYVPLNDLQELSGRTGRINVVMVRAAHASDVERVAKAVESAFPGAQVTSAKDLANQVSGSLVDAARLSKRLGFSLAVVVLAAAFLLASLLTLASVGKRVRELGTLRAIGWRKVRVVRQIVGESLVEGSLGGLVGVGLGVAAAVAVAAYAPALQASAAPLAGPGVLGLFGPGQGPAAAPSAVTQTVRIEAALDVALIGVAVALALVGGLLSGAVGALRAARLRPADALRELG